MRLVVTGATGYIGTRLTSLALKRGYGVVCASRREPANFSASWLAFDLFSDKPLLLPAGTDAVIHLAANTSHVNSPDAEGELVAARRLIEAAQKIGSRFIFVSSQAARPDAPTVYGRTKWRIEQEVISTGGWVVRPGQVYGGELRGLFGTLVKIVRQLPLLPAFVPAPKVQPIHVDDLAEGLLHIVERGNVPPGVYNLAAPEPITFRKFLDEIAKSRLRCRRGFVPVPVMGINALTRILGSSLRARLGLERLQSLFDLPVIETESDLKRLKLVLRPLGSGMHPSGSDRRRHLFHEGLALLTYVLKARPHGTVLRRYVQAIEQLRGGRTMGLPKLFLVAPPFLSLLDGAAWANKAMGEEFSWRLDAATLLAEATPSGACRFLGLGAGYVRLRSLFLIVGAIGGELFWRILRLLTLPLLRLVVGRA